jgi:stearoyl-CoA desaturase (delta-9 desaturase)
MNRLRPDWTNLTFVVTAHLLAVTAILYLALVHFSWWTMLLGLIWATFCGLSITGGYHRLFSHAAYKAAAPLRAFYLAFGAASVQNSALAWCADHRTHHAHTDTDEDPYNINRGFWWAHIGWVLFKAPQAKKLELCKDLQRDPLVVFQHRHYVPLALAFGLLLPMGIGAFWGDAIGAGLVAGFLRLVLQWHATFSINSLTHTVGSQPFGDKTSARDSFWVALVTLGEGYHNFHHRFQIDYRNGVRWYHFDPTKWWVWTCARVRLARNLRRVPKDRIEAAKRAAREQRAA